MIRPGLLVLLGVSCFCCARLQGDAGPSSAPRSSAFVATPEQASLLAARRRVREAELAATTSVGSLRCGEWPLWERYAAHFISEDGRVVDHTDRARSTSEGQAYALFFALVADDRARFDRLLRWTEDNLAAGDLRRNLPAWHWGMRKDGSYGVIDANAASDADLWLAYALLEAARAWGEPGYAALGSALAEQVARRETHEVAGLGLVLLPGPSGFLLERGAVRLNPSYLVLPILRRLQGAFHTGPWAALTASSARILSESAPRGLAPDWIRYQPGQGFRDDAEHGPFGSYDGIRVYLWSALLPDQDPHAPAIRHASAGLHEMVARLSRVPERVQVRTGSASGRDAPPGFWAVALADAHARGAHALASTLARKLESTLRDGLYGEPPAYYDQNLALYALGFVERRYVFMATGHLRLRWEGPCNET